MLSKEEKSNKIKQNYEKERMPFVWCVQAMGEGSFVFIQRYDNTFEWEEDLDKQLNNYDNEPYNQDVETVTKYLERLNYVEKHE